MALIECKNCGSLISDKARRCPKCGVEDFKSMPIPQNPIPQKVQPPKFNGEEELRANAQNEVNEYYDDCKNSSKAWIWIVLACFVIAAVGGYYFYQNYSSNEEVRTNSVEVKTDSIKEELPIAELPAAPSTEPLMNFHLTGSVGDSERCDFVMEGETGWYAFFRKGQTCDRRTLRIDSYDNESNTLILNAYLNDAYIGNFKGKFYSDGVIRYSGTYTNKRGATLKFKFSSN